MSSSPRLTSTCGHGHSPLIPMTGRGKAPSGFLLTQSMLQSYLTTFANASRLQPNKRRPKENMATDAKKMKKMHRTTSSWAVACRYILKVLSDHRIIARDARSSVTRPRPSYHHALNHHNQGFSVLSKPFEAEERCQSQRIRIGRGRWHLVQETEVAEVGIMLVRRVKTCPVAGPFDCRPCISGFPVLALFLCLLYVCIGCMGIQTEVDMIFG